MSNGAERRCSPGQRPGCAPALEPRTLAPPERRTAEVVGSEEVGAYRLLSALDEGGPAAPSPGQFYMLAAAERWGGGASERPYLPRAFSFARAERTPEGVRLAFLLEDIGPGTERLAELRPELVVAVNAAAYFSRPGPRLVDGVELLAHLFHHECVEPTPERRAIELDQRSPTA